MAEHFACAVGGGTCFACETGQRFVGCCKRNPSQDTCEQEDRLPVSFAPQSYSTFADPRCNSNGSQPYTCNYTTSTFLGCCQVDACTNNNGCALDALGAMVPPSSLQIVAQYSQDQFRSHTNFSQYLRAWNESDNLKSNSTGPRVEETGPRYPFPKSRILAHSIIAVCFVALIGV